MHTTTKRAPARTILSLATAIVLSVVATIVTTAAWNAAAAPGDQDSTYVPTAGCRAFDFRPPPDQVGQRSTPLGAGEVHTQQITGGVGECIGALAVPADAVAVAMNVTVVDPTAQSNLRLFPADLPGVPTLSNLNFSAGQAPFPNKVDVALSSSGAIKVYNQHGSTFVLGDVVGYYTKASLSEIDTRLTALESNDDLAEIDTRLAALESNDSVQERAIDAVTSLAHQLTVRQPFAQEEVLDFKPGVTGPDALVTMRLSAPVDGFYTLIASANAEEDTEGEDVVCSISTATSPANFDLEYYSLWESGGDEDGGFGLLAGTRVIRAAAGAPVTVGYVCGNVSGGDSDFFGVVLSAIFTPNRPR